VVVLFLIVLYMLKIDTFPVGGTLSYDIPNNVVV